ncbi:MAG: hypothetical protein JXR97_16130 [Planctomycetes bacterium]|nr:hypothetical protein [Planctomycetota bacterium]
MRKYFALALMGGAFFLGGCGTIKIEHAVAVAPIYANIDVNIKIKQELEEAFDYEKAREVLSDIPVGGADKGDIQ